MTSIPDFTEAEHKRVSGMLFERYAKFVPIQLADSELQLGGDPSRLTVCPTIYWNERGAHFIVCKVSASRYSCQFFYFEGEQYDAGRGEYDNLENCVLTLLQVQADHERQLANVSSGATAANLRDDDHFWTFACLVIDRTLSNVAGLYRA
ncbi:hypothetical protein GALL_43400 [mine drainage metagenome]|uniref:Uncharacterized protein n=1 Tax=mine drainage metagenome TaxID=410659 RepID=A0A1J5T307_9ZZZZ